MEKKMRKPNQNMSTAKHSVSVCYCICVCICNGALTQAMNNIIAIIMLIPSNSDNLMINNQTVWQINSLTYILIEVSRPQIFLQKISRPTGPLDRPKGPNWWCQSLQPSTGARKKGATFLVLYIDLESVVSFFRLYPWSTNWKCWHCNNSPVTSCFPTTEPKCCDGNQS